MHIKMNSLQDTMKILQETHLHKPCRVSLAYLEQAIVDWCKWCNRPGHLDCRKNTEDLLTRLPADNCELCPGLCDGLSEHRIAEDITSEYTDSSVKPCIARRAAGEYSDALWKCAIREAMIGNGLYGMSEAALIFRLRIFNDNLGHAFGVAYHE